MASLRVYSLVAGAVLSFAPALAFAQGADPGAAPPPPPPPGDPAAAMPPPPPGQLPPPAQPPKEREPDPATRPAPNSIYAEGLGAALYYSINYERRVIDDLGVRVGFSYVSFGATVSAGNNSTSTSASILTFPITASYLGIRGGKHALELGGGVSLTYASAQAGGFGASASGSGIGAWGNLLVGYRLHPIGGAGFQFRIGAMAAIGRGFGVFSDSYDATAIGVLPWGYISFGASF